MVPAWQAAGECVGCSLQRVEVLTPAAAAAAAAASQVAEQQLC